MIKRLSLLVLLMSLVSTAFAEEILPYSKEPQSLKVYKMIRVAAPIDQVWAKVGNFADMSWYPQVVASTELLSGDPKVVGAQRRLTLKNGGTLTETLTFFSPKARGYNYRLDDGVLPVSNYTATLSARAAGTGTQIIWSARFNRKGYDGKADAAADQAAQAAVEAVYDGGIKVLTDTFGVLKN